MPGCGVGCATTPRRIRGGGSAGPTTTPAARAGRSITRRSSGCGARKDYGCRNHAGVNVWVSPRHRCSRPPTRRNGCGRWTSSSTPPPTADQSRSPRSSTRHTRECLGGLVARSTSPPTFSSTSWTASPPPASLPAGAALRQRTGAGLRRDGRLGRRTRRPGVHPTRPTLAQRLHRIVQRPAARRMPQHQHVLVADPRPGRHLATGRTSTTTTAGTQPWPTKPRPDTLPPAPTDNRLSQPLDRFTGSRQYGCREGWVPSAPPRF